MHALKGVCEIGRGLIEATPIVGRIFANLNHASGSRTWWIIKICNPEQPDPLDCAYYGWDRSAQNAYSCFTVA